MFPFEQTNRCVYVLQLERGYVYVGQAETDYLERRIRMNGTAKGSAWTSIHKPETLIEVISAGVSTERQVRELENEITLQYMMLRGWEKVRGGDYAVSDDYVLYKKLLPLYRQNRLSFAIAKPADVPAEHRQAKKGKSARTSGIDA